MIALTPLLDMINGDFVNVVFDYALEKIEYDYYEDTLY